MEALKKLSEVFLDPYVVVDQDGMILDYNRLFYSLFPRKVARGLKKTSLGQVLSLDQDAVAECIRTSRHVRFSEVVGKVTGSDETMRLSLSAAPLMDQDRITAVLLLLRDETKEAEMQARIQKLQRSDQTERQILAQQLKDRTQKLIEANMKVFELRQQILDHKKDLDW